MTIVVPNSASIYTACVIVPNSRDRWAWVGIIPTVGASGSAMFMVGSALADASPLLPVAVAIGQPAMFGPFNSPGYPIIVASITGGSAVVWLKSMAS